MSHIAISLDRLKLALAVTGTSDDALLEELLERAAALIGTMTNRFWGITDLITEYRLGYGTRDLPLAHIPDDSLSSDPVMVTEQKSPGESVLVIDPDATDGFELRKGPRNAWLRRSGGYVWQRGYEYIVQYNYGYPVDELPRDIEDVIIGLIGRRYRQMGSDVFQSETIGGYSYTRFREQDLMPEERIIIDAWREPVIA